MPRKIGKKGLTKKLDKAWGKVIRLHAGNRCEVCGEENYLNSHHIVSRSNRRLRWELYNGVCLCSGCHTFRNNSAHKNPIWFRNWLKEYRGVDLKLVELTMNEIQKWTIEDRQTRLEELDKLLSYVGGGNVRRIQ